jgi:hypothetical protein
MEILRSEISIDVDTPAFAIMINFISIALRASSHVLTIMALKLAFYGWYF